MNKFLNLAIRDINMRSRKAIMWSTLGRWVFVLALMLVLLLIIGIFSGVLGQNVAEIGDWLRFGG